MFSLAPNAVGCAVTQGQAHTEKQSLIRQSLGCKEGRSCALCGWLALAWMTFLTGYQRISTCLPSQLRPQVTLLLSQSTLKEQCRAGMPLKECAEHRTVIPLHLELSLPVLVCSGAGCCSDARGGGR